MTTFADCNRELIDKGGQLLYREWLSKASPEVQAFTLAFEHRLFHQVTLAELESVRRDVETNNPPLGDVASGEAIEAVENHYPNFPLTHMFHNCLESLGKVPTFSEFMAFLQAPANRAMCYASFEALVEALPGVPERARQRALRWRLGNAYSSSFRELYTAAWLRERTPNRPNYHLFADIQLQTDIWYGQTLLCLRVVNEKLDRKRDPGAWAEAFHIIKLNIGRQGYGRMWLPTEAQLQALAAITPAPGAATTIDEQGQTQTDCPLSEPPLPAASVDQVDQVLACLGIPERPRYSLVMVGASPSEDDLETLLSSGIKVYHFTPDEPTYPGLKRFQGEAALFLHQRYLPLGESPALPCFVIDGKVDRVPYGARLLEQLGAQGTKREHFNWQQYRVEHAPADENLLVAAGAGTGKTWVMIQRIMFLLHMKDDLAPREITMVTFTREATRVMRERLSKVVSLRLSLTGQSRYLQWLEDLSFMQISTIPAFARRLLQAVGSVRGYGQQVEIRSFLQRRKEIIDQALNNMPELAPARTVADVLHMRLYEFVKLVDSFWDELQNKGLTSDEIINLTWGDPHDIDSADLHAIFKRIFSQVDQQLQTEKKRLNAMSLSDLTRELQAVGTELTKMASAGLVIKHLFVDEFQDTDDVQIGLVDAINEALGSSIFVVGDVKQAIYRFRGASSSAFKVLRKRLEDRNVAVQPYSLNKNYRTSKDVLEKLDPLFTRWGSKGWLPYGVNDRLSGGSQEAGEFTLEPTTERSKEPTAAFQNQVTQAIRTHYGTLPPYDAERPEHVAVLVRTNRQAGLIKRWCKSGRIPCHVMQGGSFYSSDAVRDFHALVTALLYPTDPGALLTLLDSPYSGKTLPWANLLPYKGDPTDLTKYLSGVKPDDTWDDLVKRCRLQPVLSVLRAAIEEMDPVQRYYDRQVAELTREGGWAEQDLRKQARASAAQYQLNLNKLMTLLHEHFNEEFVTLYGLHSWLRVQKATNRDEDEPNLPDPDQEGMVLCMTVHKAKGAEFHTVMIPFTDKAFRFPRSELLLDRVQPPQQGWQAGWLIKKDWDDPTVYKNTLHAPLDQAEYGETWNEETRLLYVALTRTKRRLWVLRYTEGKKTWGRLLKPEGGN